MAEIITRCGSVALLDDEDAEFMNRYKWRISSDGYVVRKAKINGNPDGQMRMHRVVIGAETGQMVDHINGNKLDNRRENLRIASNRENQQNRSKEEGCASKFKGVALDKKLGKWRSQITATGKTHYLGTYACEHEAGHAYNKAAIQYFGEFARLNPVGHDKE